MTRKTVVIFISGSGSNMESLIKAAEAADYPATIAAVISDRRQAAGLEKAESRNIPTHVLEREAFASKQLHEEAILQCLNSYKSDILCLAGYMRLISSHLVTPFQGRILNIHPSLLPLFSGLGTHQRAIDAGMKIAGCTVHVVTEDMDKGPIIAQAAVPIMAEDNAETLAQRVLKAEHRLYPAALHSFITGQYPLSSKKSALFSF